MPDLKKYWNEIRAVENGLGDFVWLMSVDRPAKGEVGGRIAEVAAQVAARLLHAGSHRQATEGEIQAHQQEQELARREAFRQRLQRQGIAMVPVGRDSADRDKR
jgi:hypothetical protein